MPVTLQLCFPAGRYHATPWGRHVNEGVPEWPPSPWRVLRALVAVWKRTCPELPESQVRPVLEALAVPPVFALPPHRVAHTRHYMPWEKKGPADRTLVFDTFVTLDRREPLRMHWAGATLDADGEACLNTLVSRLTSLGRAEGWVEARVVPPGEGHWNCVPATAGAEGEPVPVLCADPATAFDSTYYPPAADLKKLRKGLKPDEYLFDAPRWHLCLDTQTIHEQRWPKVPGTEWVNYVITAPPARPKATPERPLRTMPHVARFLLDGPVLPLRTDSVRVADQFRHEALCTYQRLRHKKTFGTTTRPWKEEFRSETLSGKTKDGEYVRHHKHAFYLPTAEGDDPRRVTHVTVYAEAGFTPDEVAALTALRDLRIREGSEDREYRLQLVGLGQKKEFTANLFGTSSVWESATPFVAHRHLKRRGTKKDAVSRDSLDPRADFVQLAVREMAEMRGLPPLVSVTPLPDVNNLKAFEFRRARGKRADDGWQRACGLVQLEFATPVSGPLVLGHDAHYGLGLFLPGSV